MAFLRYKQRGQKYYVYEVSNIWDKECKKYKQHSIYLGTASEKGGVYSKTSAADSVRKSEKTIVDYGDSYALTCVLKTSGLEALLKETLPEHESIIALVLYQLISGNAMSHYQNWAEGNFVQYLFPKINLNSQRISDLFKKLGKHETQQKFFKEYIARFFQKQHGILIDSTALPGSMNSSLNSWGYSANGIDKKVGCLMLVDKTSKLPIFFRAIPGEIADVSTLKATFKEIELLGLKADQAIFDAGYFSESNISYLCESQISFISRMPKARRIFGELADKHKQNIEDISNTVQYGDRYVFLKSVEISLYGYQMFAHIILDPDKRAQDIKYLMKDAIGNPSEQNDVNKKLEQAGILILISRHHLDQAEVLPSYYTRQSIEQIFGFAKSSNDLLPLRVHSEEALRGYLFLSFIVLILFIKVRGQLKDQFTPQQALVILRNLKAKIFDSEILLTELSKKQKTILSLLNITVPIKSGI